MKMSTNKKAKVSILKPTIGAAALSFAENSQQKPNEALQGVKTSQPVQVKGLPKKTAQKASNRIPEGDVRLVVNIKQEIHKKLKLAAINNDTTVGELVEHLTSKYL